MSVRISSCAVGNVKVRVSSTLRKRKLPDQGEVRGSNASADAPQVN